MMDYWQYKTVHYWANVVRNKQAMTFEMLRKFVKRDYPTFSGFALESYFRRKFEESGN